MDKLLALLKTLGFDLTGKEDQIKAVIAELEKAKTDEVTTLKTEIENLKKANSTPTPPPDDKTKDNEIAALKNDIAGLTKLLTDLQTQGKTQAEAAKAKMEADRQKKIADLKAKGIAEGRITEATWESKFKAIAEKDVDSFETLLPSLAVDPHFKPSPKVDANGKPTPEQKTIVRKGPMGGADVKILESINNMNSN